MLKSQFISSISSCQVVDGGGREWELRQWTQRLNAGQFSPLDVEGNWKQFVVVDEDLQEEGYVTVARAVGENPDLLGRYSAVEELLSLIPDRDLGSWKSPRVLREYQVTARRILAGGEWRGWKPHTQSSASGFARVVLRDEAEGSELLAHVDACYRQGGPEFILDIMDAVRRYHVFPRGKNGLMKGILLVLRHGIDGFFERLPPKVVVNVGWRTEQACKISGTQVSERGQMLLECLRSGEVGQARELGKLWIAELGEWLPRETERMAGRLGRRGMSPEDRADLSQEMAVRLLERPWAASKPYAERVGRNLWCDAWRRQDRRPTVLLGEFDEEIVDGRLPVSLEEEGLREVGRVMVRECPEAQVVLEQMHTGASWSGAIQACSEQQSCRWSTVWKKLLALRESANVRAVLEKYPGLREAFCT